MAYILLQYDGQRIPNWGLSFNTPISILAVVSKMAALYGATSAISQLKWVWFAEHGKTLVGYKTFDGGSRGVAGAALLAWNVKGRSAAVLGALAVIIGAAAGPFAQQIVHFYEDQYIDAIQGAWVPKAETITALGPKFDSSSWQADQANAAMALFLPAQERLLQPNFGCPTGNCTFPEFDTLAFCPVCADISLQLERTCAPIKDSVVPNAESCTVSFPGPSPISLFYIADPNAPGSSTYALINSTSPLNATVLTNLTYPTTLYQSIHAVVDAHILGGGGPTASGQLENNGIHVLTQTTRFIGQEYTLTKYSFAQPLVLSPPWNPTVNYTIIPEWLDAMLFYSGIDQFGGQLKGTVTTEDSNQAIRVSTLSTEFETSKPNDALQAVFYADFNGTTCPTPDDNVGCVFRALAKAMSKSVRDAGVLRNGTAEPWAVQGETGVMGVFIRVEWPWFALPVAVWALSLLVVIVAGWRSRGVPLWKESALPLVLKEAVAEGELSKRAEVVGVKLDGGLRIGR
ncbi:hypothetical protein OQA88_8285 [Cercophora sp. LCS_1]